MRLSKRFGFSVLVAFCVLAPHVLAPGMVSAQERPLEIPDRIAEVRELIDQRFKEMDLLQQHLNAATDDQNTARIEKLREDIAAVRDEIDDLRELEQMLIELQSKDGRPPRSNGTRFGGSEEERAILGSEPALDVGPGSGRDRNPASGANQKPELARPRGDTRGMEEEAAGRPRGKPQKPELAGGRNPRRPADRARPQGVERDARGKPTSPKLRALETSYRALVEAGDMDLAAEVLIKIRLEKKRLEDLVKKEEREQREREKGRRNGASPDGAAGGRGGGIGLDDGPRSQTPDRGRGAGSRPDGPGSRPMTVEEIEDAIRQLQEQLDQLRERQENGGGARR